MNSAIGPLAAGIFALVTTSVHAQLKLVVPYPSGGNPSRVANIVGPALAQALGKSVTIQHAERGSQIRAAREALTNVDENTLLIADMTFIMFYKGENAGNGVLEQGNTAGIIGEQRLMVVTAKSNGPRSVEQLRGNLTTSGGSIGYVGSNSPSSRCAGEIRSQIAGTNTGTRMFTVTTDLIAAVNSGAVAAACVLFQPAVAADTSVLAISGRHEFPGFESVPLFDSERLALNLPVLVGIFTPKSTPQAVVDEYSKAISQLLTRVDVRKALSAANVVPDR